MQTLAIFLIGYSAFSALVIALTHFRRVNYPGQRLAQVTGVALLLVLTLMQLMHFGYLQYAAEYIHSPVYRMLLFSVAPVFYLYSKPLLQADTDFRPRHLLHLIPIAVAPFVPYAWALPLAFTVGALYLLWLARTVWMLRAERSRFRQELGLLAGVFVIATAVSVTALGLPWLGEQLFYLLYACAIGCAFLLVSIVLGMTPQLARDVGEAARETYAVSTLNNVDGPAALARLDALMQDDKLYRQATL
ncbi:MAG: AraC family transcriptional regulator, partial [Gammaproteobacteria bacterium]